MNTTKKTTTKGTIKITMTARQLALYDIDDDGLLATSQADVDKVARRISTRLTTIARKASHMRWDARTIFLDAALWDLGENFRDYGAGDTMSRERMMRAINKAIAASRR